MQIALILDIHGNAVALRTVFTEIEENEPDRIVCLGDVAATGSQPFEALDMIRELGCPVVMGNADEELLTPLSHTAPFQSIYHHENNIL